jgi:tRNA A-37 threonylcarbamoyl transferase component Bud32
MGFIRINPEYQSLLERHGLTCAERLVELPGLIVSGHPERNVARVMLGDTAAYLKREHRVRWRDRLRSAADGFGFSSLAVREADVLAALRRAGVPCPEWMAVGEGDGGRAFLLLRALPDAVDLRQFLQDRRRATAAARYEFARRLGAMLAAIHEAGFDHPDLYAKHVLVAPASGQCYFLDWQRSRRRQLGWRQRARDLAALDATLTDEAVTGRERLACLHGCLGAGATPRQVRRFAQEVRRWTKRLLRYGHVRKERASPPPASEQGVFWLDGEALCVTREYWQDLRGKVPAWLPLSDADRGTSQTDVALPGGRRGLLVRRASDRRLAWLWCLFRRRPLLSPELRQAGALFRLQKHGLPAPRVLAFGQRRPRPWRTQSFLLTEVAAREGGET